MKQYPLGVLLQFSLKKQGAMTERLGAGLQNLLGWFDSNWRLKNNQRTHRWKQRKFATTKPNMGDVKIVRTTEVAS